jgi:hypothetical protein
MPPTLNIQSIPQALADVPSWVIVVIAAGTIVASVVGALNGLLIALIQTRSQRQLAIDNAHRAHRAQLVAPFSNYCVEINGMVSDCYSLGMPGIRRFAGRTTWLTDLRELQESVRDERFPPRVTPTGDSVLDEYVEKISRNYIGLRIMVLAIPTDDDFDHLVDTRVDDMYKVAVRMTGLLAGVPLATEGYVFGVRSATKRGKKRLASLREPRS